MVRCMGAKSSEVELEHSFKARQWYHVALTLSSGSALTPGWARLYVDGLLEASERFKYPKVHCQLRCMHSRVGPFMVRVCPAHAVVSPAWHGL